MAELNAVHIWLHLLPYGYIYALIVVYFLLREINFRHLISVLKISREVKNEVFLLTLGSL